ncbi:uncharacterized protein EDB93DRAFT_1248698 [Suillus bovinus]|uniref:uncharacterized protein n=1 Tax=Suillus bovinus TaxID=48563 RepID=UPI001B8682BA|nr:uncharacterized protein EDB93DRAFT_1248698 [Suillus bovinus]KAG2153801.1 hypothetical protein EDB93DRAFT_1248698 [Suillus bovinus]
MSDSDSNSTSFSLDSGSDSADEGTQCRPVAPPSSGASIEHYQEGTISVAIDICNICATPSASESTATSGTTPDSLKTSGVDKVILGLAKKYALITEMFLPDKVIFQMDCPDPPVDFSSLACYAKKSTEKSALITELYTSIDYTVACSDANKSFLQPVECNKLALQFLNSLHSVAGGIFNMPNEFFVSKYDRNSLPQVMDLIGWEAGKGQAYDIFKRAGGPPSYAKIWKLTSCTPGLIAFGVTSIILILSPDQEFSGDGVGAIFLISYHSIFKTVKKIFILKCAHQRIKSVVEKINGYVFDGTVKTQPSNDTSCTVEHITKSLDHIMAALDASDSDDSDLNQSDEELEYVNLPATKDTHHSTAATAVTITPSTPSPSVSAAVAAPDRPTVTSDIRDYPDAPHTSILTPQLPTFMALQAEILGDPEG